MRILIDLQGAQTTGSRHRGIGRYSLSLAEGIIRERGDHDVHILLNGAFPESIADIRSRLSGLLDDRSFHVFHPIGETRQNDPANSARRHASELIREAAIAALDPDVVHVTSHFEGFGDEAITSFHRLPSRAIQSVTLYDLIPYIHADIYLENPAVRRWYEERLLQLRRADLLLSISASSGLEVVEHLGFPEADVVDVGTAADPQFVTHKISKERAAELRGKYGLNDRFVMYTGGIDYRKNIERLIGAFGKLGTERRNVSLAIVCSCNDADRRRLDGLRNELGMSEKDVVLTGFVPEEDLVDLYNLCELFVFPSWHEGFGLPALEAMHSGAPVIGSDRSSLPEVIGSEDALFNPFDESDIAAKLKLALTNKAFRSKLLANSRRQSKKFSWKLTAQKAVAAFERAFEERKAATIIESPTPAKPRLAYVSPIPPAKSGIADYSAELLPELSRHYDIDVVVPTSEHVERTSLNTQFRLIDAETFLAEKDQFERVLYHFGNSDHHGHMVELIRNVPGVVVLHDFYLSGLLACLQQVHRVRGLFTDALFESHGFQPLIELSEKTPLEQVMWSYPANRQIIERALGVIVHSDYSKRLAREWLGGEAGHDWSVIPLMRTRPKSVDRKAARAKTGVADEFLICSFGGLGETKQSDRLVEAFWNTNAYRSGTARLVFIGSMPRDEFGQRLQQRLADAGANARVEVTAWASAETYKAYLQAADLAVQLRTLSRGETSAAALDCLNYGIPTIVNANGSMADLPDDAVFKLDDEYETVLLSRAIDRLIGNANARDRLADRGRTMIRDRHDPRRCADEYRRAIEQAYKKAARSPMVVAKAIAATSDALDAAELTRAAELLAPLLGRSMSCTVFIDIGLIEKLLPPAERSAAIRKAAEPLLKQRRPFEVVALSQTGEYSTRRKEALAAFDIENVSLDEHVGRLVSQDEVKLLAVAGRVRKELLRSLSNLFVRVEVVNSDRLLGENTSAIPEFQ